MAPPARASIWMTVAALLATFQAWSHNVAWTIVGLALYALWWALLLLVIPPKES